MPKADTSRNPATASISQSDGLMALMAHWPRGLQARDLPVSYAISTANEVGLDVAEFIDFMIDDPNTRSIIAYLEQAPRPQQLLAACVAPATPASR